MSTFVLIVYFVFFILVSAVLFPLVSAVYPIPTWGSAKRKMIFGKVLPVGAIILWIAFIVVGWFCELYLVGPMLAAVGVWIMVCGIFLLFSLRNIDPFRNFLRPKFLQKDYECKAKVIRKKDALQFVCHLVINGKETDFEAVVHSLSGAVGNVFNAKIVGVNPYGRATIANLDSRT